jgi:hypothetical protein
LNLLVTEFYVYSHFSVNVAIGVVKIEQYLLEFFFYYVGAESVPHRDAIQHASIGCPMANLRVVHLLN